MDRLRITSSGKAMTMIVVLSLALCVVFLSSLTQAQSTTCEAGMYLNPVFGICTICPPGFVAPADEDDTPLADSTCGKDPLCNLLLLSVVEPCTPCPRGTSPNDDRTECIPCSVGTMAPTVGSPVCLACPAGQFANENGTILCTRCPRGTFTNVTGSPLCEECPENEYIPETGSTFCLACPLGKTSVAGSIGCVPCPCGTSAAPEGGCQICDKGTFAADVGSTFCKACPPNTYAAKKGSSYCTPCPYGSWSPMGSTDCFWSEGYSAQGHWQV